MINILISVFVVAVFKIAFVRFFALTHEKAGDGNVLYKSEKVAIRSVCSDFGSRADAVALSVETIADVGAYE